MDFVLYALAVVADLSIPVRSAANTALNKELGQAAAVLLLVCDVAVPGLLASMPLFGLR